MRTQAKWLFVVGAGAWAWTAMAKEEDKPQAHRGAVGQQFTVNCAPMFQTDLIWGTDVYTDDSHVCTAAIHMGLITQERGGQVTYQIQPGQTGYQASTRHGITSYSWSQSFDGSFSIVSAEPDGHVPEPDPSLPPDDARRNRGKFEQQFSIDCAPGFALDSVWGTDIYTDDSDVCTAAVHAGVITQAAGGTVTYEIRPGQKSFASSTRHGVTTMAYNGTWDGSFAIVGGQQGGGQPGQPGQPGQGTSACGLGSWWEVNDTDGNWLGTWTRQGESNTFSGHWTRPGEPDVYATLTIEMSGSSVTVDRVDVPSKFLIDGGFYEGTIAADGVTVTGTVMGESKALGPMGPFDWSATIHCE